MPGGHREMAPRTEAAVGEHPLRERRWAALMLVLFGWGCQAEIVGLIETWARDNPAIPAYQGALARAHGQAGRGPAGRAVLDRAAGGRFTDLPPDLLWTYGTVTFAEAAIRLGHVGASALLYEQLEPFHDRIGFVGTTCEAPIVHYLGGLATVLRHFTDAERRLGRAAAVTDQAVSPFFGVRAIVESGRLAVYRGGRAAARTLLDEGRELALSWGFTGGAACADDLLVGLD